jgi:hypothetical protein
MVFKFELFNFKKKKRKKTKQKGKIENKQKERKNRSTKGKKKAKWAKSNTRPGVCGACRHRPGRYRTGRGLPTLKKRSNQRNVGLQVSLLAGADIMYLSLNIIRNE